MRDILFFVSFSIFLIFAGVYPLVATFSLSDRNRSVYCSLTFDTTLSRWLLCTLGAPTEPPKGLDEGLDIPGSLEPNVAPQMEVSP